MRTFAITLLLVMFVRRAAGGEDPRHLHDLLTSIHHQYNIGPVSYVVKEAGKTNLLRVGRWRCPLIHLRGVGPRLMEEGKDEIGCEPR